MFLLFYLICKWRNSSCLTPPHPFLGTNYAFVSCGFRTQAPSEEPSQLIPPSLLLRGGAQVWLPGYEPPVQVGCGAGLEVWLEPCPVREVEGQTSSSLSPSALSAALGETLEQSQVPGKEKLFLSE